jgi:hypothetical protein
MEKRDGTHFMARLVPCSDPLHSATALSFGAASTALGGRGSRLFGAASAAFGRSLLSVAFGPASAGFCRRSAAGHQAGACQQTRYADPREELPEFLRIHGAPPFVSELKNKQSVRPYACALAFNFRNSCYVRNGTDEV